MGPMGIPKIDSSLVRTSLFWVFPWVRQIVKVARRCDFESCIKSHLYHVVSLTTCNVFMFFTFAFIIVLYALSISIVYMYIIVTCDIKYQPINQD